MQPIPITIDVGFYGINSNGSGMVITKMGDRVSPRRLLHFKQLYVTCILSMHKKRVAKLMKQQARLTGHFKEDSARRGGPMKIIAFYKCELRVLIPQLFNERESRGHSSNIRTRRLVLDGRLYEKLDKGCAGGASLLIYLRG